MPSSVSVLERPVYGFSQVDGLLRLPAGTARRWIDGYERSRPYPPVIRPHSTGVETVTWGEFIEVTLLAQYRDAGIPMQRLRPVVQSLRNELGLPYPLAHYRPWVAERDLFIKFQNLAGLAPELQLMYAPRTGQTVLLADRAQRFFDQVAWGDVAAHEFALAQFERPVVVNPRRSFGAPTAGGIRTDIIAELVEAGESAAHVARTYGVSDADVRTALEYERSVA